MRIRFLELPREHPTYGGASSFAMVIDQCDEAVDNPAFAMVLSEFAHACGARGRLITDATVNLPGDDTPDVSEPAEPTVQPPWPPQAKLFNDTLERLANQMSKGRG